MKYVFKTTAKSDMFTEDMSAQELLEAQECGWDVEAEEDGWFSSLGVSFYNNPIDCGFSGFTDEELAEHRRQSWL